jgi:hypothetical protein
MESNEVRPFLAAQRHDILRELAADRNDTVQQRVVEVVSRGINSSGPKLDGKAGAIDGTIAVISFGDLAAYVPICGAYPGPKIEFPKSKDGKEDKEGKEGKDSKEGKEAKDSKEGKEGKEAKDSKEGKEGKEDKDTSDGFKVGGSETLDPFHRFGELTDLPSETFNGIAQSFPSLLNSAIARGGAIF